MLKLFLSPLVSAPPSECFVYTSINDNSRSVSSRGNVYCDSGLTPNWYRFTTPRSNVMPETCVAKYHCNTNAPGWLSGPHPTVSEGIVTRQVCYNWNNNCCNWRNNIKVRNCSGFYVYELQRTTICHLRYCTSETGLYIFYSNVWLAIQGVPKRRKQL